MRSKFHLKIHERILNKNKILTKWNEEGIPSGSKGEVPRSIRQFAKWENKTLKLQKITTPNAMTRSGPYASLVLEAERLMNALFRTQFKPEKRVDALVAIKSRLEKKEAMLERITNGWHKLKNDNDNLKLENLSLKLERDRISIICDELRHKLKENAVMKSN